ncbi:MAG: 2-oxo acid dehydrogenase subunit E2 [Bdellovibrionaceae bacterium]|nr:2-oxo acid dehydrogenase subunit E2 [Pseudobdellovibrionaceae bacterium]
MATKEIQLPEIGEGVTEGELVKWLVKTGDTITADQSVVELMTDKATVEVPAPFGGTVKELKFKEGDVIKIGATIVVVDDSGTGAAKTTAPQEKKEAPKAPVANTHANTSAPVPRSAPQAMTASAPQVQPPAMDVHVLATPSTRRLAREMNVDINHIPGTGLAGRVTREDVARSQGAAAAGPATYAPPKFDVVPFASQQGQETREPLRGIRKKIAENLQMAKHIIPHFTLMDEANVTGLVNMREELKATAEKKGVKVTYLPFVMKALIATIREFPKFNSSIDDAAQEIVSKKYFNVGFAADTPNGLLVPVLKDADRKTILQLSAEITDLAMRARDGKLKMDEMKGATFTITNIGSVGGTYATPIINHPEVAIFGMYKIQERPFVVDGELQIAKFMNFTVTCDHRLIDGAEAGRFLSAFIKRIENPGVLMMDMM